VSDRHELVVLPGPDAVRRRGAEILLEAARDAVARHGAFTFAVSGGPTPNAMLERAAEMGMPWDRTGIWQVDERVAPDGHVDRNLTGLIGVLPAGAVETVRPMPVTDADLDAAAERYAAQLPPAFDLVHLGIGDDGHTASLVPGDPVLDVRDRDVALTGEYRGRRRMTFTYRVLDGSPFVLWLVTGEHKARALAGLVTADPSIPAGRVRAERQVVVADAAAASAVG
jgi:6-phosphogluconolactonase